LLITNREEEESESPGESEDEDQLQSSDVSSDEDEAQEAIANPYAKLLQSLSADSGPSAKRRKLDIDQANHQLDKEEGSFSIEDVIDRVEEEEEGPETAIDGVVDDEDEEEDPSDPFEAHFADPDENNLAQRLKALQKNQWSVSKPSYGTTARAIASFPGDIGDKDDERYITPILSSGSLKLKQKLSNVIGKQRPNFDELESVISPSLFNYRDVLFCDRMPGNAESLRRLVCLHAINHVFKCVLFIVTWSHRLTLRQNSRSSNQEQCTAFKGRKQ
jgi:U3 small nucleolar RNA-associated protein 25